MINVYIVNITIKGLYGKVFRFRWRYRRTRH